MVSTRQSSDTKRLIPSGRDARRLSKLKRVLKGSSTTTLASPGGEEVELPSSLRELLLEAVRQMTSGKSVSLISTDRDLTTQEAADLLSVSRPHLISLLESGQIPFHKNGSHRRVPLTALREFEMQRDKTRRAALEKLTQESQDLGMYEL